MIKRGIALFLFLSATAILSPSATKKTRKKPAPSLPPPVSAQAREEAVQFVNARARRSLDTIENAAALVPFFAQLADPPKDSALHVLHYGDSHTASDDWANTIRVALQNRFGNGGPGFALAGTPYKWYRRYDIFGNSSPDWTTEGTLGHFSDGRYGLGGISISTHSAGQTVSLTAADVSELKLLYLRQPNGGQIEISVDGAPQASISTNGPLGPGAVELKALPGSHEYVLRTLSNAPVRLFGWTADNRSGITWEELGINGAQAPMLLDWDEQILSDHLARRNPALIVLAYGTNEAISPSWSPAAYADQFGRVLDRLRRDAPLASILVIGPPDCQFRLRNGQYYTARLSEVIDVQREIAMQHRCAFWDLRARMGGTGSVEQWVLAGYSAPDHIHMSRQGYQLIGEMLVEELMEQYHRFQAVKTE